MQTSLVITTKKTRAWYIVAGVIGLISGISVFQLGKWDGQSERKQQEQEILSLSAQLEELEFENIDLNRKLEEAIEKSNKVEADKQLTGKIEEQASERVKQLQQRVKELEKELSFFKGVMSPDGDRSGLQIEKFVVEREVSSEEMSFRLSLTQAKKHNSHLSGIVSVLIFGKNQAGEDELFDFNPKGWKFRFKYLQKISGRFTLPAGFKPSHVQVTAKTKGKKPVEVTEEFVWQLTEKKNANAE